MDKPLDRALVWFRRDLRADDHAALYHALRAAHRVWCVFVFDTAILDALPRADRRVEFIHASLEALDAQLRRLGGALQVVQGAARDELPRLAHELSVQAVFANHDDDPYALERDAKVRGALADAGIVMHTSKDHVIFERTELMTGAGAPYSVFTPYKNAWLSKLEPFHVRAYALEKYAAALVPDTGGVPALEAIGFQRTNLGQLKMPTGSGGAQALFAEFLERIDDYAEAREFPSVKGPSYLGVHLRFGTLSVRQLAREAWQRAQAGSRGAQAWLGELIWRDFYHQLLHHHPHVVGHAFKPEYDAVKWEHGKRADGLFDAWRDGRTGYPLVDAAMAQIAQTGYMHNRLRMVTASFLVKDLGIDWRRGEAYFAEALNDYDLAANNGGWQWAAGTGSDAAPYFRVFNPVAQSRKFDAAGRFIRRYLPQLGELPDEAIHAPWLATPVDLEAAGVTLGRDYPLPIVDHDEARKRTLDRYGVVQAARR